MAYTASDDRWAGSSGPTMTARAAAVVTPSDTVDLSPYAKALYIGVSGDVTVVLASDKGASGTAVLFKAVPVGWFPVQVRRVNATGTTATNINALSD